MANVFKYCTKEQEIEFLKSLNLGNIRTLYSVSNHIQNHYDYLEIPKKSGGKRKLMMPDLLLKMIQQNILKHVLYGFHISSYAKAYYKGADILDNAIPHVNRELLLKLDLKDFFHHVTFDMVKELVFKEEYFPESIRVLLTNFCCYQNTLPQGAPTSPTISNIVMKEFDECVGSWCRKQNIVYTRYSDDLTFSGNFDAFIVIQFIKEQLKEYGFELNERKIKLLTKSQRQSVTGVIINQKPNTARDYRKEIRKQIYYIKKYGIREHLKKLNFDGDSSDYLKSLEGKIRFVLHINAENIEFQNYLKEIRNLEKK